MWLSANPQLQVGKPTMVEQLTDCYPRKIIGRLAWNSVTAAINDSVNSDVV
jgi:hypothetical protein